MRRPKSCFALIVLLASVAAPIGAQADVEACHRVDDPAGDGLGAADILSVSVHADDATVALEMKLGDLGAALANGDGLAYSLYFDVRGNQYLTQIEHSSAGWNFYELTHKFDASGSVDVAGSTIRMTFPSAQVFKSGIARVLEYVTAQGWWSPNAGTGYSAPLGYDRVPDELSQDPLASSAYIAPDLPCPSGTVDVAMCTVAVSPEGLADPYVGDLPSDDSAADVDIRSLTASIAEGILSFDLRLTDLGSAWATDITEAHYHVGFSSSEGAGFAAHHDATGWRFTGSHGLPIEGSASLADNTIHMRAPLSSVSSGSPIVHIYVYAAEYTGPEIPRSWDATSDRKGGFIFPGSGCVSAVGA